MEETPMESETKKGKDFCDVEDWIVELDRDDLAEIVKAAFSGLWLDDSGVVMPDQEVSGADYVARMAEVLQAYGLGPVEETPSPRP